MQYHDEKLYHIFNRGAHQSLIFYSRGNYSYCLSLLQKYKEKYKVAIVAYCLMPNHYHLVLKQLPRGSISRYLQTVFNAYTQAVNRQKGKSGTLFQGRAKARIIESDHYALQVIRYVHLNPVAARKVETAEEWEFSDYGEWIGMKDCCLSDLDFRDSYFPHADEYRLFVEAYKEEKDRESILKSMLG
jgi:REP element-mobilizing transposase RayT